MWVPAVSSGTELVHRATEVLSVLASRRDGLIVSLASKVLILCENHEVWPFCRRDHAQSLVRLAVKFGNGENAYTSFL
jgi:hypothetical protein